jgi:hypothetical protein
MPYLSPRKSHARKARILPLRGRLGFRRSMETTTPQTCLRMRNTVDIRFAASEPATNKALQEVGFLGGFGLFGGPCCYPYRLSHSLSALCLGKFITWGLERRPGEVMTPRRCHRGYH